ncbi:class I SAM-dependent methyltransferase [Streptomyces sp. WAC07149]|uniref:class I SAM-dependent methyltransferase n=1 Tax=Streptomyces sp. WAC07149 TaxID=2487425 RepID=UPI000F77672C|nr:class I SAM-dependent methyltransferase [Streptomyces sp. WAC07149]RST07862.1 class I SAM-dependent methyltransferase [Streptomyces sp. WAC07149]
MTATVPHNYEHERALWDAFADSAWKDPSNGEPVFRWTQYKDHPADPGPDFLGAPASALEIGSGTGRAAAYLAERGVKVTGVDLSPVAVDKCGEAYGHLGIEFVCAEILAHLAGGESSFDAVYSIFGAAWFTDPARLFPLVAGSLNPGGIFAFSQPPAIPGAYGPQGMYKGGFAGPAMFTYRYSYPLTQWKTFMEAAGFSAVEAREIEAPTPGHIGTLLVRGVKS